MTEACKNETFYKWWIRLDFNEDKDDLSYLFCYCR